MNSRIRRPLYISLKSWLCCCSLPTVAPQQLNKWNNYQAYLYDNFLNKRTVEMRKFDCNSFRITGNTNFKKKLTSFVSKSVWGNPAMKVKVQLQLKFADIQPVLKLLFFDRSLNDCYEWTLRNKIIHTEVMFWKIYYNITKLNRALWLVSQPLPFSRGCTLRNWASAVKFRQIQQISSPDGKIHRWNAQMKSWSWRKY